MTTRKTTATAKTRKTTATAKTRKTTATAKTKKENKSNSEGSLCGGGFREGGRGRRR
jgi:hypothetical protein